MKKDELLLSIKNKIQEPDKNIKKIYKKFKFIYIGLSIIFLTISIILKLNGLSNFWLFTILILIILLLIFLGLFYYIQQIQNNIRKEMNERFTTLFKLTINDMYEDIENLKQECNSPKEEK